MTTTRSRPSTRPAATAMAKAATMARPGAIAMAASLARAGAASIALAASFARAVAVSIARESSLALAASFAMVAGCGGVGSGSTPIQGTKRDELCSAVERPPPFVCPSGTRRMGKPPPDGNEMWCQRWDGTRHGSYRRFPPGAEAGARDPDYVSDGAVVGEYREGEQQGAWWSRQRGVDTVNVAFYEDGKLVQRVKCRP